VKMTLAGVALLAAGTGLWVAVALSPLPDGLRLCLATMLGVLFFALWQEWSLAWLGHGDHGGQGT
jgi:hypothetical protein